MASTILSDNGVSSGSAGLKSSADSTGVLALQTSTSGGAATTAVTIDTSQNVGIGTSSTPATANYKTLAISGTTGAEIFLQTGSTNYGYIYADNGGFRLIAPASGAATGTMQFSTSNTERMRIDSSGNVGIGTASPADKLDVTRVSSSNSTGGLTLTNTDNSGYGSSLNWNLKLNSTAGNWGRIYTESASTTATFMAFQTTVGSTLAERMRIDLNGVLLVNTTARANAPDHTSIKLAVAGEAHLQSQGSHIWFGDSTNASPLGIGEGLVNTFGTDQDFLSIYYRATCRFFTTTSEVARFDSSGRLLVGTPNTYNGSCTYQQRTSVDSNQVHSLSNSSTTSPYIAYWEYPNISPNNTVSYFLQCNDNAGSRFILRSNGGLSNYQANDTNLSDRREKTNFAPAKPYLDTICAIPVQTFNYIDQNREEDDGLTLGVVAQDVQAVAPELVMESNWAGKDEEPKMRLSVYQTDLQYALMKSIQELKAINDTQAETINALTARIVALESRT